MSMMASVSLSFFPLLFTTFGHLPCVFKALTWPQHSCYSSRHYIHISTAYTNNTSFLRRCSV